MDLGITGKIALVAGASSGMGRATAELLAREGCLVAVAALPADQVSIDETVAGINASGAHAVGIAADFTVGEEVQRAIGWVTKELGPPDIAIANVDGPGAGLFDEVPDEKFRAAVNNMTMSVVYLVRAVLPHMRVRHWGRIVALNSMAAKEPEAGRVLVSPSRAAVVGLCKSLADEVAADGITVNSVGTGWFHTDRMIRGYTVAAERRGVTLDTVLEELKASLPARRLGRPQEMAAVLAFLCSEGAGYITGEFINVDGGYHRSAF
jgi:3-oxoacyl-[acyl-carrier protein] reductase